MTHLANVYAYARIRFYIRIEREIITILWARCALHFICALFANENTQQHDSAAAHTTPSLFILCIYGNSCTLAHVCNIYNKYGNVLICSTYTFLCNIKWISMRGGRGHRTVTVFIYYYNSEFIIIYYCVYLYKRLCARAARLPCLVYFSK